MISLPPQSSQYDEKQAEASNDTRQKNLDKDSYILVAHPNETICRGLRAILIEELVSVTVSMATTAEEFQARFMQHDFDLVMLHQSYIPSGITLPQGKFVLLATEPTIEAYFFARNKCALAYLMENTSRSLLQQTLRLPPGAFLIGPVIGAWLQEYFADHLFLPLDKLKLTPREQEVFHLQGASHHIISQRLRMTESTVRTHLSHIYEKLHLNRAQMTVLSKWLSQEKQER